MAKGKIYKICCDMVGVWEDKKDSGNVVDRKGGRRVVSTITLKKLIQKER